MRSLIWLVVAAGMAIVFSGAPADAQPDSWAACRGTEAGAAAIEQRIAICSAIIVSETTDSERRSEAYMDRGNAYQQKGDFDRAISDYDQAIQLTPKSVKAYQNRGLLYLLKNDFPHAIADLDHAVSLEPDSAANLKNRGAVYLQFGYCPQAMENFQSALKITPKDPDLQGFLQMADRREKTGGCRVPDQGEVAANTQAPPRATAQVETLEYLAGTWTERTPMAVVTWDITTATNGITISWFNSQLLNAAPGVTVGASFIKSYQLTVAGRSLSGVARLGFHNTQMKCDLPDVTYPVSGRISSDGKMLVIQGSFPGTVIHERPCRWGDLIDQSHTFIR